MSNLLICTVGLPRSGKTSWARRQGVPVVNPDSIRLASHGQRFWAPGEKRVWADAHQMVRALFLAGHETVIVDATNTTKERRAFWTEDWGDPAGVLWTVVYRHFDVPVSVCHQRAEASGMPDLIPVIDRMAAKFEPLDESEKQIGETGSFPRAPLNDHDEGELSLGVGTENDCVAIHFGKPIAWLGLTRDEARQFAIVIAKHAAEL